MGKIIIKGFYSKTEALMFCESRVNDWDCCMYPDDFGYIVEISKKEKEYEDINIRR